MFTKDSNPDNLNMTFIPIQGKLYTGKEGLAFSFFKCAAGGVGILL